MNANEERYRIALQKILDTRPCVDQGGGVFYPHFDGDGNEIGIECIDPLSVVQRMAQIAEEALSQ